MNATLLYLDTAPDGRIQTATLAGIRRYAASLRCEVVDVPPADSRPANIATLLAEYHPVAGCIVDGSGDRRDLPPRVFGAVPVIYMHTEPSLYGGHGMRVGYDDAAIAEAAFRELSAGHPAAFAIMPFDGSLGRHGWALRRARAFAALAAMSGKPVFQMPWRKETKEQRETRLVRWLATLPRHTAVFAVSDVVSVEVAAATKLCHRSIPRELTLLGVDNDPASCEASHPTLSSIQIDHELAGYLAAKAIGERYGIVHKSSIGNCSQIANGKSSAPGDHALPVGAGLRTARNLHLSLMGNSEQLPIVNNTIYVRPLLAVRRESTGGSGRREPFVLKAVEAIRHEACDGLTAAALAKRFRCSRPLFDRRFREAVGHSPLEEILHVRLEKVFTLLSRTDTPVGVIADFCGFRSSIALRWLFRKRTGMSMREWRKHNRHP